MNAGSSPGVLVRRPGLMLTAILLAVLVVPTGVSGIGVALPDIAKSLSAGTASLQWSVNAFNLSFAAFSLVVGSIADLIGRKRGFIAGAALFLLAAVASALAPSVPMLDAARGLAGVGAAAVFACGGALLAAIFEGPRAGRVFAYFGTAAGLGLGVGPTLSGVAISVAGWRAAFAVHAVAIALVIALVWLSREPEQKPRSGARVDIAGAVAFLLALLMIMLGVVQGSQWGWTNPGTLGLLVAGAAMLALFGYRQRATDHPLLDLELLRNRYLVGLLLVPVAGAVGFVTVLTYLPVYMTGVWGDGAAKAGVHMLAITMPVVVAPLLAGWVVAKGVTPRIVLVTSVALFVAGTAWLTIITPHGGYTQIVVPMVLLGSGFGLGVGLVDGQAISSVPPDKSGMVSGLVSTVRLGSEAVAVAVYGSVLATLIGAGIRAQVGPSVTPDQQAAAAGAAANGQFNTATTYLGLSPGIADDALGQAYTNSLHIVLWALAVVGAAITVLVAYLTRRGTGTPENIPTAATEGVSS